MHHQVCDRFAVCISEVEREFRGRSNLNNFRFAVQHDIDGRGCISLMCAVRVVARVFFGEAHPDEGEKAEGDYRQHGDSVLGFSGLHCYCLRSV